MLVKLIFTKEKRFFYKIKIKTENEFLIATAPNPRNIRQKKRLIQFLKPFEKRIIYPMDFCIKDYPAPYPAFEIHCRNLLLNFLEHCKNKRPNVALITPNGVIKDNYYFDLSEYVGKIILNTKNQNNELKSALLGYSGTVLEYNTEYDKSDISVAVLTMPKAPLL